MVGMWPLVFCFLAVGSPNCKVAEEASPPSGEVVRLAEAIELEWMGAIPALSQRMGYEGHVRT